MVKPFGEESMKIAIIGGSLRKDSLNLKFLGHLACGLEALGARVRIVSGPDLRIPLYDGDTPAPPGAVALHGVLADAVGLVIVSPEYNAGIPPHLKNAVDWVSTLSPNPFKGLPVLLASVSPGAFGGARAQVQWRATLANLGAFGLPQGITIPLADKNLAPDGAPLDPRAVQETGKALAAFLDFTARMAARP
jgi:NAD(P)H-dependent FMN reductase